MKAKFVLCLIVCLLLGLWFHKQKTHVYLAQCGDSQFHEEILYQLQQSISREMHQLPERQREQTMGQYHALQIQIPTIKTQITATREQPTAHCIATVKMSPQNHLQQILPLKQLFQQHQTVWQPEMQTASLRFTANSNHDELSEAVKINLHDTQQLLKLPTKILLEWNALTQKQLNPTPSPKPQNTPPKNTTSATPAPKPPQSAFKPEETQLIDTLRRQDKFLAENSVFAHTRRLMVLVSSKNRFINSLSPTKLAQWQEYEASNRSACTDIACHIQREKTNLVWLEQLFAPSDKKTILNQIDILMMLENQKLNLIFTNPILGEINSLRNITTPSKYAKCGQIHCQIRETLHLIHLMSKETYPNSHHAHAAAAQILYEPNEIGVLTQEIMDLIVTLSPPEREAWFKNRDDVRLSSVWKCQLERRCNIVTLREQKRILQTIRQGY